jgi:hypothetical protein
VEVVQDGRVVTPIAEPAVTRADQVFQFSWSSDGKPHWVRVNVRGGDGKLWLLGNPVYVNLKK